RPRPATSARPSPSSRTIVSPKPREVEIGSLITRSVHRESLRLDGRIRPMPAQDPRIHLLHAGRSLAECEFLLRQFSGEQAVLGLMGPIGT
ncbi:hypothetical protein ACIBQ1_56420, partial [Nonomuraea sp. NPDC050153]|uniref:hypothetical protein n=1 Tax=Nonomuraea sp. NPDC050153 TaxID=3364359 RepID=UPI0037ADDFA0